MGGSFSTVRDQGAELELESPVPQRSEFAGADQPRDPGIIALRL